MRLPNYPEPEPYDRSDPETWQMTEEEIQMSTDPRSLKQLAQEAMDVQNACNPLGVSKSYAKAVQELRSRLELDNLPCDTDSICVHPVNQLWASKLHSLACMGMSHHEPYENAYNECKRLASS